MRTTLIAAIAALLPVAASAQDIAQRPVKTEKIMGTPVGAGLYEVAADGTVSIDWRTVEATAEGPADRVSAPVAKMMLAIRDGKWKQIAR
ncbi:hypothetical protein SAMN05216374_5944 [Tardiphaga sp. OK246]|uniref:hypothetical protein n=1 Tax=Tardiphaga sp. OK246 TaxID=1855307 RepID=UPI000B6A812F|nr:hypothetical protein [Tardiphaga sp. OK246]SNT61634.1 hypothetical protein SAMN05216374_5944 [Tardiphaga sp. OK246]